MKKIYLLLFFLIFQIKSFSQCGSIFADAGYDQTICLTNPIVNLNGGVTGATGGVWTTSGTGTFADSSVLNTTYTPSAEDAAILLTLTTTGNGACTAKSDQMVVIFTPIPVVSAGSDKTICSNNLTVTLNGSVTNASGWIWTTSGTGIFANPNSINTTYTVSAADILANSVTLTLSSTDDGCGSASDQVLTTIAPLPIANAGANQSFCYGASATNVGTIGQLGNTYSWQSIPLGFTSSIDAPSVNPSVTTSYILTASSIAGCQSKDTVVVTVNPIPVASAGIDKIICPATNATIGTTAQGGNTYSWESIPAGFSSFVATNSVNPSSPISYVLTVTANSCSDKDTVVVNMHSRNQPTITLNGNTLISSAASSYQWKMDNTVMEVETWNKFLPNSIGDYVVKVTDINGCIDSSDVFTVINKNIGGLIRASNNHALPNTKVYLLRLTFNADSIYVLDSTTTGGNGYYTFNTLYSSVYISSAPNGTLYSGQIPTYYPSSIVFQNAVPVSLSGNMDSLNFKTIAEVNPGGIGIINGVVNLSTGLRLSSRFRTTAIAASNMKVFLIDSLNQPVGTTYTDASGYFQFSNLDYNKYKIWIDKPLLENSIAPIINLNVSNPLQANIEFVLHQTYLERTAAATGIIPSQVLSTIDIYPNPANDFIFISQEEDQNLIYAVFNTTGQLIKEGTVIGKSSINIADFENGIYLLRLQSNDVVSFNKIVVE